LTEIDGDAFAMLCQLRSYVYQLHRFIKDDEVSEDKIKYTKELRLLYQSFEKMAGNFGLTPRNRVGLVVNSDTLNDDPLGLLD
jgi:hypothetical protein